MPLTTVYAFQYLGYIHRLFVATDSNVLSASLASIAKA